jgi:ABC-type taurine transport system substrate-binding protein
MKAGAHSNKAERALVSRFAAEHPQVVALFARLARDARAAGKLK